MKELFDKISGRIKATLGESSEKLIGKLTEKLKSAAGKRPKQASPGGFGKIGTLLQTLVKRKVLLISILVAAGVVVALVVTFRARAERGGEIELELGREGALGNIEISLESGTFPTRKTLRIRTVRGREAAALRSVGSFEGEFYELIPSDGVYDMPTIPITVRYYIQNYSEALYWTFVAVGQDRTTYNVLPGGFIRKSKTRGFYIESNLFVLPRWIGVTTVPGKTVVARVEKVRELVTDEPALLIVPGSDLNFAGIVELGKLSSAPLWERIFPKRSIFVYRYPIAEVRPKNYVEYFDNFIPEGVKSEITYHANQLADFLRAQLAEKPEVKFDILAHEIGGLIVYYCLAKNKDLTNVRRVAYLSTPFLGTNLANPALASKVYGTETDFADSIYRIPKTTFSNLKVYLKSYLETIGALYRDLLPRSKLVQEIELLKAPSEQSSATPTNVGPTVAVYMGNTGPLSIDVSGSFLENLYPELVSNKGDGLVTIDSAAFPFTDPKRTARDVVKLFPGAWNSFYSSKEFIDELTRFFKYEPPKLPAFTNDQFSERVSDPLQRSLERFVGLEDNVIFKTFDWKLSDNPKLSYLGKLDIPGNQIEVLGNVIYTADETGMYVGGSKIWEGRVRSLKLSENGISYSIGSGSDGKVVYRLLTDTVEFPLGVAEDFLALRKFAIFAVQKPNNWYDFVDERGSQLARLWGVYSKIIYDGDEIIFLTNRELYRFSYGIKYRAPLPKVRKKPTGEEELVDPRSYDMTYAIGVEDLIIATTRSYGLLVFDKTGSYFYTGEGWVGNVGLYVVKNYVVAVGSNFITIIDVEKREIDRIVQDVKATVYDAAVSGNVLYLMTDKGVLMYQIN